MSYTDETGPRAQPDTPTPAGMYDFWLGGAANTPADEDAASRISQAVPEIRQIAWANRGFLMRAVTWMAQRGIRQFIDLGAGFPTQRPTHEIARAINADCRVIYTDNDPRVVARGRQILADVPETAVIEADIHDAAQLFGHADARRLLDLTQPAGLLAVAVTQFVPDTDDPWRLIARHMDPLAPRSYLALSAPTADHKAEWKVGRVVAEYAGTSARVNQPRTKTQIERFFAGLELVPPYEGAGPGLAHVGVWGCDDPGEADDDASRWFYAGVAAKPWRF